MRSRSLRLLGVAAVVAATLAPGASALAADPQSGSPSGAIALDKRLTGQLGPGGTFAYYRFYYSADGSVATINLDAVPDDSFMLQQAGFHVYAPNGDLVVTGGAQPGASPDVSANVITSDPSKKGDYIVQIYNYDVSRPFDFTLWTAGSVQPPTIVAPVPSSPPAAAPPTATPAPTTPAPTPVPSTPGAPTGVGSEALTGRLAPGGTSAQYEFNYPGDDSVYTLNMVLLPRDPAVVDLAGFEVYGPDGSLVVKGGAQHGMTANVSANVISKLAGRYLVKVVNYHPSATVDYSIVLATSKPTTAAV